MTWPNRTLPWLHNLTHNCLVERIATDTSEHAHGFIPLLSQPPCCRIVVMPCHARGTGRKVKWVALAIPLVTVLLIVGDCFISGSSRLFRSPVMPCCCFFVGDYPAPRAVLTGHDHEVVCVSVCAELGLVISGAKGQKPFPSRYTSGQWAFSG